MDSLMQPLVEPWAHLSQRGERQDAEARGAHADAVPGEEVAQNSRPQSGPQPQGSQQAEPLQGDVVWLAAGSPTTLQQSGRVPRRGGRGDPENAPLCPRPDQRFRISPIGPAWAGPPGGLEGTPPEHDGAVRER